MAVHATLYFVMTVPKKETERAKGRETVSDGQTGGHTDRQTERDC